MSITPFLDANSSAELTRIAKVAFEMTRVALQFPENDNPVATLAAKRIVEFVKAGEHNPDALCERVLSEIILRASKFQQQAPFDVQRGRGFSLLGGPAHRCPQ
jgi:hypothetical protein